VRSTCVAVASAIVLFSVPALGQTAKEPHDDDAAAPTFAYTTPHETDSLRALLELGAVFTLGFTWYATSAPTVHRWDPGYRWAVFKQKITGTDLATDGNSFGTNFVGHPMGGTGYYLSARSNRMTILASSSFAVTGSLLWEVFGEVSEVVSINDMITTPLAGIAIGEATTQLGAHFDRAAPTTGNRVLGSVFAPIKSINDALDGLEPARAPRGAEPRDFSRFHLEVAGTFARVDPRAEARDTWWPEARLEAASEIVRLPGYEKAGHDSHWFDDGNVSRILLTGTLGSAGLTDFAFQTNAVVTGHAYRATRQGGDGALWGGNGFAGFGFGFQYTLHQYRREQGRAMDRIASVRPLAIVFEQRGSIGGPRVVTSLEVGPDFGGVTPVAIAGYRGPPRDLPYIQGVRGYYFGAGGHGSAGAALEAGPLNVAGDFFVEGFREVGSNPTPHGVLLFDALLTYSGSLGYRDPVTGVMPRIFATRRVRAGGVADARESIRETTLGFGVGAVF
jgi:hypothetical protein